MQSVEVMNNVYDAFSVANKLVVRRSEHGGHNSLYTPHTFNFSFFTI